MTLPERGVKARSKPGEAHLVGFKQNTIFDVRKTESLEDGDSGQR
jgi:hypothetical protein